MTATMKTWYIADDSGQTYVDAADADEAARIYAQQENIKGVTDVASLREAIESVDGILYTVDEHDNHYAVVDDGNTVRAILRDSRISSDVELRREMEQLVSEVDGKSWVYVEGRCNLGDVLEIDEDGCATVVEA